MEAVHNIQWTGKEYLHQAGPSHCYFWKNAARGEMVLANQKPNYPKL